MSITITKETKMADIIKENFMTLVTLKKYGMMCADCAAKNNDTIEECAKTHHIDVTALINELSKFVSD